MDEVTTRENEIFLYFLFFKCLRKLGLKYQFYMHLESKTYNMRVQ